MKNIRLLWIISLAVLAAFIWLRAQGLMQDAADTIPVLAALPFYLWLARPWIWRREPLPGKNWPAQLAVFLLLAGVVLDLTLLLALSWCLFLYVFLHSHVEKFQRRLLLLPLLAFPWISTDLPALGWWFRFSGAAAAEALFTTAGFHVQREGTFLVVQGLPLAVDAACSGLNVLQALLIAGFAVVYLKVPAGIRFWSCLACLGPLAWLANTARILTLGIAALSFGSEFAMGWFHQWGGWLVLCVMFLLCQWFFGNFCNDRAAT